MIAAVLVVLSMLTLIATVPTWPYNRNWGYYPTCGCGLIFIVLVALALFGRI